MRHPTLLIAISLALVTTRARTQDTVPSARYTQQGLLAAGPFLFGRDTIPPTYMDAFDTRPVVGSPDRKLAVTVTGPKRVIQGLGDDRSFRVP